MQNVLEMAVLGANAGQETYLLTYLLTYLVSQTKGVYREEGMQLAPFSESSDFVLSYF